MAGNLVTEIRARQEELQKLQQLIESATTEQK
jgi:hypothetical protein